jgi:hypothetical protein
LNKLGELINQFILMQDKFRLKLELYEQSNNKKKKLKPTFDSQRVYEEFENTRSSGLVKYQSPNTKVDDDPYADPYKAQSPIGDDSSQSSSNISYAYKYPNTRSASAYHANVNASVEPPTFGGGD